MAAEAIAHPQPLASDLLERVLGWAALALLAAALAAIMRGHASWGAVPPAIWLHLGTVIVALTLTPVILWQRRGTRLHRRLGYVWASAMFVSALDSFWILETNHGHFSVIHLLSAFVAVQTPRLVLTARAHNHAAHRRTVRGLVIGGLLTAGALTFPFHRLLGRWLLG
ncbi:DUF2306 domain-containing protein [Novosphingobium sp.]|uniref:DUF2306 domain-containing protein n=1 Tax=Novosphingobium sp. TaxID=1874826 RepID=UPI002612D895|nr:DUF2306 domain-containing protein [Novosphingobium sp.]